MTKRWLSCLLATILLLGCFASPAFAAPTRTIQFLPVSTDTMKFTPNQAVVNYKIGTIKVNASTITGADWTALLNKIEVTATGIAVGDTITPVLAQNGDVSINFTAVPSAVAPADLKMKTTADTETYVNIVSAGQPVAIGKVSVDVPVSSILIKKYNGTTYADVTTVSIDATYLAVGDGYLNYNIAVGALPTGILPADKVVTAVSSDSSVVTASVEDLVTPAAEGLLKTVKLTGKKVGTAKITISAGGKSKELTVAVLPSNIKAFTLSYPGNVKVNETMLPTITVTDPTYATETAFTFSAYNHKPDGGLTGNVISLDATSGEVTGLLPGTVEVMGKPVKGTAAPIVVEVTVVSNTAVAVAPWNIVVTPKANDEDGDNEPYTEPQKFTMKTATANCAIRYTLDGTLPTATTGTLYDPANPLILDQTQTNALNAIAYYTKTDRSLAPATASIAASDLNFDLVPAEVKLDKATMTIQGATASTLSATITPVPSKMIDPEISWTSSNDDVIENAGIQLSADKLTATFTPKAAGTTNITISVTANETTKTAFCVVTVADVKAISIALNKTSATLPNNETLQLSATASPSNALISNYTWGISNTSIATVDAGLVQPIDGKTGSVTVTATEGRSGKVASCVVNVTGKSNVTAAPYFTVRTSNNPATGTPVSGTEFPVTTHWLHVTSPMSDAATAISLTVIKDGEQVVNPDKPFALNANGTYVVSAFATAPGLAPSATVSATYVVSVPVTSLVIKNGLVDVSGKTIDVEGTEGPELDVVVEPTGADVKDPDHTWTSSDPSVAVIYAEEKIIDNVTYLADTVYTFKAGKAVLTATSTDPKASKSASVTINATNKLVTSVTIANALYAKAGQNETLVAEVLPTTATNKKLNWTITQQTPANIATIEAATGHITYLAAGTIKVAASAVDGSMITGFKDIMIATSTGAVEVPVVYMDGRKYAAGAAITVTVAGKTKMESPTTGATIRYTTDGVTPTLSYGTTYTGEFTLPNCATLKVAAFKDGVSSTVSTHLITFDVELQEIKLTPSKTSVMQGESFTVKAEVVPENANVTLAQGDLTGAAYTVNSFDATTKTYKVTANLAAPLGKNLLTLAKAGKNFTCEVTITKLAPTAVEIISSTQGGISVGSEATLTAIVSPSNVAQTVVWHSSDEKVATVSVSGVVKAVASGSAVITATSTVDSSVKGTYTVTVKTTPTDIPAPFTTAPELVVLNKTFEVMENGSLVKDIAKFNTADLAAINYYYSVKLTVDGFAGLSGQKVLSYNSDTGVISLIVKNPTPAATYSFGYTWKLEKIPSVLPAPTDYEYSQTGYSLKVAAAPSEIDFTGAVIPASEMLTTETKTFTIGKVNNMADFLMANVAVTGTSEMGTVTVANDGTVTLTVKNPAAGVYTVKVTLKAQNCADVTSTGFELTVKLGAFAIQIDRTADNKFVGIKGAWNIEKTPNTALFTVPGATVTKWTSSAPKIISINKDTGAATIKKLSTTGATITAVTDKGTFKQKIKVVKFADTLMLNYKTKKMRSFKRIVGDAFTMGMNQIITLKAVNTGTKNGKVFGLTWTSSNEAIAKISATGLIDPIATGEVVITAKTFDGIKFDLTLTIIDLVKEVEEKVEDVVVEEEIIEEELEEIDE